MEMFVKAIPERRHVAINEETPVGGPVTSRRAVYQCRSGMNNLFSTIKQFECRTAVLLQSLGSLVGTGSVTRASSALAFGSRAQPVIAD